MYRRVDRLGTSTRRIRNCLTTQSSRSQARYSKNDRALVNFMKYVGLPSPQNKNLKTVRLKSVLLKGA